jgi:hypothetical protein
MEKIINKLIEAVSQLKKKNTELADQVKHSTSIASKAVQLAVIVKQQNNELKNLSRKNKELEANVSTLKTIKHEYPKEVKISNFPADKKVQEVRITNKEIEKPKWLPELFADFFKVYTTVQSKISATVAEQAFELLSKLWRGGIGISFKGPQPFYIVDEHGVKIRTKELLSSMRGGGGTTIYRSGGGLAGKVKINAFKFGDNPTKYDVDNSAVQIYDSTLDQQVTGLIITNSVDAGDLYIYSTNAVTTTNFLFKLGAGDDKQLALGYDATGKSSLFAIRAAAQTNDDVIVTKLYEV